MVKTAINEANISFKEGDVLELARPVRVIPREEGGYFGGEITGSRGRGSTAATLTSGTKCRVIKRLGNNAAWVAVESLDKPIRIDINKFDLGAAEKYFAGKSRTRVPPSVPSLSNSLSSKNADPEARLAAAREALKAAKAELEAASKAYEASLLGDFDDKTPADPQDF